jgi:hypothetical protein
MSASNKRPNAPENEWDTNKRFHLRNPFASSADTSPSGSMAEVDIQHTSKTAHGRIGATSLASGIAISSSNGTQHPVGTFSEDGVISPFGQAPLQQSGLGQRQNHRFKTYLLTEP